MAALFASLSWSAAFTGGKALIGFRGKVKAAPIELRLVQQACDALQKPLEICTELATRHILHTVMVPVIQMCEQVLESCDKLHIDDTPDDEGGWKMYLEHQTGLEGITRFTQLERMLPKLTMCSQALTTALTTAHAICGKPIMYSKQIPWSYNKHAHRLAHKHFFETNLKSGVVGIGNLYKQKKTGQSQTLQLMSKNCQVKFMSCQGSESGTSHRLEFLNHDDDGDDDCYSNSNSKSDAMNITKDTHMQRKFLSQVEGIDMDDEDDVESRLYAFDIQSGDQTQRYVFVPCCGEGSCEEDSSSFPLSAELFEAVIALSIFTAANMPTQEDFTGNDDVTFTGSPQSVTAPNWINWYTFRFLNPNLTADPLDIPMASLSLASSTSATPIKKSSLGPN